MAIFIIGCCAILFTALVVYLLRGPSGSADEQLKGIAFRQQQGFFEAQTDLHAAGIAYSTSIVVPTRGIYDLVAGPSENPYVLFVHRDNFERAKAIISVKAKFEETPSGIMVF